MRGCKFGITDSSRNSAEARQLGFTSFAVVAAAWAAMAAPVTTPVSAAPATICVKDKVCAPLASPALAVKAGRHRGLPVLDRRRLEMEAMVAADATAAAKRHARAKAPAQAVIDPALPNGVGIQGRGRAAMNAPMADGTNCVAAMQQRRQSLLAAAEFRRTQTVIAVAPAGAGKFDGMPDR